MKITFKRIKSGDPEIQKLKQLYIRAFPAEERAPFLLMLTRTHRRNIDFWSLHCNDEWAGMLYVINDRDLSYIFYLALTENMRGNGIGSAVLKAAHMHYKGRRLFLAIEQLEKSADNYSDRVRRRSFYLRNGFTAMGRKLQEGKVVYEILGSGGDVLPEEYRNMMKKYAGHILSKLFTMEFVD